MVFPGGSVVENLPAKQMWVRFLGGKDPLEKEMQPTPKFLPGGSPQTEEPGGLQSTGMQSQTGLSD